jgi:Predicted nucleic acid-binding protein, contains PIN domain
MIVVADASPLNYLIQIDCHPLLRDLFGRVFVPGAVIGELRHAAAPAAVHSWLLHLPSWVEVHTVSGLPDESLTLLDPGEREAIQLALELQAALLLIDERRGRTEAKRRGIATTGTLGVLLDAGRHGLVNAELAFQRLVEETSFRASPALQEVFLEECRRPRGKSD